MWLIIEFLLVLLAYATPAIAAPESQSQISPPLTAASGGAPPPAGRLRFKSAGPVCMCGEGLSEKDIERAMARQAKAKQPAAAEGRNKAPTESQTPNEGVSQ